MDEAPWRIHEGDVRRVLRTLPRDHYDAVLSDPPYGLSFMGKRWDYAVPGAVVWEELIKVMKPGAHVLIFGGPRTFHRMMVNVEDGGLEPRDVLMWLYAQGMPKGLDIGKHVPRWKGWGTNLKPGYEPILLARRYPDGSVVDNVREHGTGGLAIDACRLEYVSDEDLSNTLAKNPGRTRGVKSKVYQGGARPQQKVNLRGRYPANVLMDADVSLMVDEQSGERPGGRPVKTTKQGYASGSYGSTSGKGNKPFEGYNDTGGASRFFFVAKVRTDERDAGAEDNAHPTLKPIELTKYLATMLLPPKRRGAPRRILVPYSGAGSEMIGCIQAGWEVVEGIENDPKSIVTAKERITRGGVFSTLAR